MFVFSMAYAYMAISLETDFEPTNEKFFPFVLALIMGSLSVLLFLFPSQHSASWPDRQQFLKIALLGVTIFIYTLVLPELGFIISATLLLGVCMKVFGAPNRWIIPVSVILTISFYVIFDRLLGLNLPMGLFK